MGIAIRHVTTTNRDIRALKDKDISLAHTEFGKDGYWVYIFPDKTADIYFETEFIKTIPQSNLYEVIEAELGV